jgi:transcriptional regulator with GAF, ATPase, and Fis domain
MQQTSTYNQNPAYKQPVKATLCPNAKAASPLQHNEIIGDGAEVKKTLQLISKVAPGASTVLILGETGTGKELIARAIHNSSLRNGKAMIKMNCAALPANLIESELFGHEKGSFTGAFERRIGKFELAHQGTLFLDEIGEMPPELQVKLLRVLQEREIERIGGKTSIKVDVRIIAATNRNLEKEMEAGQFRPDLYYRLHVFPIQLQPLRNRREDIPLLVQHFIRQNSQKTGRKTNGISDPVMTQLINYSWPGNIRQLEHVIERSVLLSESDTITHIHLPLQNTIHAEEEIILKTIDENERDHILKMLKFCKSRIAGSGGAAELLGVPPSTLYSKIKRLGIKREHIC